MDNLEQDLQQETAEHAKKLLAGRKPRKPKAPPKKYVTDTEASCIEFCPTCGAPRNTTDFARQQHYARMPQCDPSPIVRPWGKRAIGQ